MVSDMARETLSRRTVLRNGAVITGGLAAGGVFTGGAAASEGQGQGGVGYISTSSYEKIVGEDDVDCVDGEEGWGDTFYVRREAWHSAGEAGVFIDVPPSCNGNGPDQAFRGYLITAEPDTECGGGPSGSGPWDEDCCSWLFLNPSRNVRFGIEQRIAHLHRPDDPCHEAVKTRDDGGNSVGTGPGFDVVRVTFAPVPDGGQNGNGPP